MNHPTSIQPKLIAVALKSVNYAVDYTRIKNQYDEATFNTAWTLLSESDRARINEIVTTQKKPTPEELAALIVETSNREQLQTLRDDFGEELTVAAWGLLDEITRQRIVKLCEATKPVKEQEPQAVPTETVVEPEPQTASTEPVAEPEHPPVPTLTVTQQGHPPAPVEPVAKPKPETVPVESVAKQKPETVSTEAVKKRGSKTLLELDEQLEQLDDLIEAVAGEITPELQQAFDDLLEQQEETRDLYLKKLDNYAALIQSRKHWAEIRKAEGDRLRSLAEADFKTVDFRDRSAQTPSYPSRH